MNVSVSYRGPGEIRWLSGYLYGEGCVGPSTLSQPSDPYLARPAGTFGG